MQLPEQLALMRQLGLQESEEALLGRLRRAGNDLQRAVDSFFEESSAKETRTTTEVPKGPPEEAEKKKRPSPDVSAQSIVKSPRYSSSVDTFGVHGVSAAGCWLVGRRITLGYTLNAGLGLRTSSLSLKFEGVLASHKRNAQSDRQSGSKRKKNKFSAANLLFSCTDASSGNCIRGRLSNLICNFLVPLLKHDMIIVRGHIAYDCGNIGTFQDLPLSLQVFITDKFVELMKQEVDSDIPKPFIEQNQDTDDRKAIAKAGNDLLIWLMDGEDALIAARNSDKKMAEYTEKNASQADSNECFDDSGVEEQKEKDEQSESNRKVVGVLDQPSEPHLQPVACQPEMITGIEMKKYQLQALHWMMEREKVQHNQSEVGSHSPDDLRNDTDIVFPIEGVLERSSASNESSSDLSNLWACLVCLPTPSYYLNCPLNEEFKSATAQHLTTEDMSDIFHKSKNKMQLLWWNRYTQVVTSSPPPRLEQCRGGILADEMGLGKTIMSIALVVSDNDADSPTPTNQASGTLIVCPMSLMSQWMEEFRSRVRDGLRVLMYYGSSRDKTTETSSLSAVSDRGEDINPMTANVLITSYGVLTSEWRRSDTTSECSKGKVLLGRRWRRVILDEGHVIRNPRTDTAKACYLVEAERRWVLSGTPIQNKVDDLFSLMKFLRHQPWDKWRWWFKTITQPSQSQESGSNISQNTNSGIRLVQKLLSSLMLRRCKSSIDAETGRSIVALPPREVHYVYIELTPPERSFYSALARRSTSQMLSIMSRQQRATGSGKAGGERKSALSGYAELFTLLMRLRQTCDHPLLVLRGLLDKTSLETLISTSKRSKVHDGDEKVSSPAEDMSRVRSQLLGSGRHEKRSMVYLNDVLKSLEDSWKGADPHQSEESDCHDLPGECQDEKECCICFELMETRDDAALTTCGHLMCWTCAHATIGQSSACPVCSQPTTTRDIIPLGSPAAVGTHSVGSSEAQKTSLPSIFQRCASKEVSHNRKVDQKPTLMEEINWQTSSKLSALQEQLEKLFGGDDGSMKRQGSPNNPKVVIFSQWTGMLDLVETMINTSLVRDKDEEHRETVTKTRLGLRRNCFVRFDGSMSQAQRSQSLHTFSTSSDVRILLISLKAGGVGLNLTAASHLFLLDPWWNPAVEDQAIDRVHRLGQKYTVKIMRMVCRDTVEEKLLALQEKKRLLCKQAMSDNGHSGPMLNKEGSSANKLSLDELKSLFL